MGVLVLWAGAGIVVGVLAWLWAGLVEQRPAAAAALKAGAVASGGGLVLSATMLLLGPASVPVVAVIGVLALWSGGRRLLMDPGAGEDRPTRLPSRP